MTNFKLVSKLHLIPCVPGHKEISHNPRNLCKNSEEQKPLCFVYSRICVDTFRVKSAVAFPHVPVSRLVVELLSRACAGHIPIRR